MDLPHHFAVASEIFFIVAKLEVLFRPPRLKPLGHDFVGSQPHRRGLIRYRAIAGGTRLARQIYAPQREETGDTDHSNERNLMSDPEGENLKQACCGSELVVTVPV